MKIFYALFLLIAAILGMVSADNQQYTYTIPASQEQHQNRHHHKHRGLIGRGEDAIENFVN